MSVMTSFFGFRPVVPSVTEPSAPGVTLPPLSGSWPRPVSPGFTPVKSSPS